MIPPSFNLRRLIAPTTIRNKLFLMVVALLIAAMHLVYLANASLTIHNGLQVAHAELELLANVTSNNLEASLLFKDEKGAQEALESLKANPNITMAEVRDIDNKQIARLSRHISNTNSNRLLQKLPVPQTISVEHAIRIDKQLLGTLTIQSSLSVMWQLLFKQLAQLAAIMAGALVFSAILIRHFSKLIVNPIDRVAYIAKEITQGGNYALRVPASGEDEVGKMAVALNMMLSEIEQRDQELRIAAVAFESQEGMVVTDVNQVILRVNRSFTKITGYSAEEAIGQTSRLLQYGLPSNEFYAAVWERVNSVGSWQGEILSQRKDGEIYPEWLTITAVKSQEGILTHYVATLVDITERKANEDKITQLAFYDSLTQLPNRRLLLERLSQRLAAGNRSNRYGALMFIDLDKFKILNDTLGHHIGDLLLQQVGQRLLSGVREADTVARLGGDEFVVLLDDLSENSHEAISHAEAVGEKILATLNQPYQLAHHEYRNTASIGMTVFSGHQFTLDEIMKRADTAMYEAKKAGRNTLLFFDPAS